MKSENAKRIEKCRAKLVSDGKVRVEYVIPKVLKPALDKIVKQLIGEMK
jgi:hypothetical protein